MQTEVELKILNPKMADSLPAYATPGSAGLDLRACLDEAVVLQPGDVYLVPTGLAVYLANPAYAAWTTGTIIICAIRSIGSMVNASLPRFHKETFNSP